MIILIVITTLARIMIKVKITMLKVSLEYASVIGAMTTTLRFDSRVLFLPKPKYSIGLRLLNEIYLQTKDAAPFLLGLNPRSSLNPPPPPPFVSLARWGGGSSERTLPWTLFDRAFNTRCGWEEDEGCGNLELVIVKVFIVLLVVFCGE